MSLREIEERHHSLQSSLHLIKKREGWDLCRQWFLWKIRWWRLSSDGGSCGTYVFDIRGSPKKQKKFGSPTKLRQWFLCSGDDDSSSTLASRVVFVFDLEQRNFNEKKIYTSVRFFSSFLLKTSVNISNLFLKFSLWWNYG